MEHVSKTVGLIGAALLSLGVVACGDDGGGSGGDRGGGDPVAADPVIDPGDGGDYAPELDPADFVDTIDNPYLPLPDGARWVYEGVDDGEAERVDVVVTGEREQVMGIAAVVVRDTVFDADGQVLEDTYDWYAQDLEGNVWYLGEETAEYEDGEVVSTASSWRAGTDGAYPGIVMPADPTVGHAYRQEYWPGEAEDLGEVVDRGPGPVTVPAGTYDDVVVTRDWNPLEPDVVEEKTYAAGVGFVRETKVTGGEALIELVEVALPAGS